MIALLQFLEAAQRLGCLILPMRSIHMSVLLIWRPNRNRIRLGFGHQEALTPYRRSEFGRREWILSYHYDPVQAFILSCQDAQLSRLSHSSPSTHLIADILPESIPQSKSLAT